MVNHTGSDLAKAIKTLDPSKTDFEATTQAQILIQFLEEREKARREQKIVLILVLLFLSVMILINVARHLGII